LGAVAVPGTLHALPGHCEVALQGAPEFVPPAQRVPFKPPQMPAGVEQNPLVQVPLAQSVPAVHGRPLHVPPGHTDASTQGLPPLVPPTQRPESGQSALVAQDCALPLLQVSHWHRFVVKPVARQGGFDVLSVRVLVPVVFVRSIPRFAMLPPASGGQSRLVEPHSAFGDVPLMSHARVARSPAVQVPPRTPSFAPPSPTHRGHGSPSVGPEKTLDRKVAVVAAVPLSTFAVPLIVPLIWLPTQVATPPAASGR